MQDTSLFQQNRNHRNNVWSSRELQSSWIQKEKRQQSAFVMPPGAQPNNFLHLGFEITERSTCAHLFQIR